MASLLDQITTHGESEKIAKEKELEEAKLRAKQSIRDDAKQKELQGRQQLKDVVELNAAKIADARLAIVHVKSQGETTQSAPLQNSAAAPSALGAGLGFMHPNLQSPGML